MIRGADNSDFASAGQGESAAHPGRKVGIRKRWGEGRVEEGRKENVESSERKIGRYRGGEGGRHQDRVGQLSHVEHSVLPLFGFSDLLFLRLLSVTPRSSLSNWQSVCRGVGLVCQTRWCRTPCCWLSVLLTVCPQSVSSGRAHFGALVALRVPHAAAVVLLWQLSARASAVEGKSGCRASDPVTDPWRP
jgi:hypothetical protein